MRTRILYFAHLKTMFANASELTAGSPPSGERKAVNLQTAGGELR